MWLWSCLTPSARSLQGSKLENEGGPFGSIPADNCAFVVRKQSYSIVLDPPAHVGWSCSGVFGSDVAECPCLVKILVARFPSWSKSWMNGAILSEVCLRAIGSRRSSRLDHHLAACSVDKAVAFEAARMCHWVPGNHRHPDLMIG